MNKRSHYAMSAIAVLAAVGLVTPVHAVEIKWADWTAGSPGAGTATGEILTTTSTVTFDYAKTQGSYSFIQTGSGTDYFAQGPSGSLGRVPATSPYTKYSGRQHSDSRRDGRIEPSRRSNADV